DPRPLERGALHLLAQGGGDEDPPHGEHADGRQHGGEGGVPAQRPGGRAAAHARDGSPPSGSLSSPSGSLSPPWGSDSPPWGSVSSARLSGDCSVRRKGSSAVAFGSRSSSAADASSPPSAQSSGRPGTTTGSR